MLYLPTSRATLPVLAATLLLGAQHPASTRASRPSTRPATQPASRPAPAFHERLLETTAAWAEGKLGRDTAVEVDGTIMPLREVEERASAEGGLPNPSAVALAMANDVVLAVLTNALRRTGKWPKDELLEQVYEEHAAKYDRTPFTTKVMATAFKGYPTLDAYRRRFTVLSAYGLAIEKELTDDALAKALEPLRPFLTDQTVKVSMLSFVPASASDWSEAERRAEEARQALLAGASFESTMKEAGPRGFSSTLTLNPLRKAVGDSEYSRLVVSRPVSDVLFSQARVGAIVGPLRGVDACWVGRVDERSTRDRTLDLEDPKIRELVRTILLEERFIAWSGQVLARAILRVHER